MQKKYKPVVLAILDGWGESENKDGNAILNAQTPTIDKLNQYYPKMLLEASGMAVGVTWGEEGNSEVGHQTLGAGQVIYQNLPRIDLAIENGSFFRNEMLLKAINYAKKNNSSLHLMGLLSDGGVHSHINHLFALLDLAKLQGMTENVFIHIFTDGRDTGDKEGIRFIKMLQQRIKSIGTGKIATITGRYYAMDRNQNYDRIQLSFQAMTEGVGIKTENPIEAIEKQYQEGKGDEYLKPIVITEKNGALVGKINDNDAIIFFNFREDRARQLVAAFIAPGFDKLDQKVKRPQNIKLVGMTKYKDDLPMEEAFPRQSVNVCLGKIISENGLKQLRIAETEKYAHVTYFFNVGMEKTFKGEDRALIPSKNLSSYADAPEMSAREITSRLLTEIGQDKYDFILVNYANPDMVGHTGNLKASIKAVETIDAELEKLIPAVIEKGGCLLITADHGNAEEIINLKTGEKDTEHSQNPVPLWFITPDNHDNTRKNPINFEGMLTDIAPTILDIFGIKKPAEMTGESLLPKLK